MNLADGRPQGNAGGKNESPPYLSLPAYCYDSVDIIQLHIVLAEDSRQNIIGIAAWEQADTKESPAESKQLSLHGIYLDPLHHRQGIGSKLFAFFACWFPGTIQKQ